MAGFIKYIISIQWTHTQLIYICIGRNAFETDICILSMICCMLVDGDGREMVSITSAYYNPFKKKCIMQKMNAKHRTRWMVCCYAVLIFRWIFGFGFEYTSSLSERYGYGAGFWPRRLTTENEIHFLFRLRMLMAICLSSLPLCPLSIFKVLNHSIPLPYVLPT